MRYGLLVLSVHALLLLPAYAWNGWAYYGYGAALGWVLLVAAGTFWADVPGRERLKNPMSLLLLFALGLNLTAERAFSYEDAERAFLYTGNSASVEILHSELPGHLFWDSRGFVKRADTASVFLIDDTTSRKGAYIHVWCALQTEQGSPSGLFFRQAYQYASEQTPVEALPVRALSELQRTRFFRVVKPSMLRPAEQQILQTWWGQRPFVVLERYSTTGSPGAWRWGWRWALLGLVLVFNWILRYTYLLHRNP